MNKHKSNWFSTLGIPRFGDRRETEISSADPVTPTEMRVAVGDIVEYENNPRRAVNAKLDEIRLSIRQRGFEGTLDITRRPGEKFYIPVRGGNTTLACIKEIYRETGNSELGQIRCLFHPWVSELNTRLNHLIENDIRGDLIFIDKAQAVMAAWEELNREAGAELSQSKLSAMLRHQGYKIDQTMISRMQYAVQKLRPCIPTALDAGLGFHSVVRIRQLEKAFAEYLVYRGLGDEVLTAAEAWFSKLLASHDSEEWEIKPIIHAVVEQAAALTSIPISKVRSEMETLLAGGMKALTAKGSELEASVQPVSSGEQDRRLQSGEEAFRQQSGEQECIQRDFEQECLQLNEGQECRRQSSEQEHRQEIGDQESRRQSDEQESHRQRDEQECHRQSREQEYRYQRDEQECYQQEGEQEHYWQEVPLLTEIVMETSASEETVSSHTGSVVNGEKPVDSEKFSETRDTDSPNLSATSVDEKSVDVQRVRPEAVVRDGEPSASKLSGISDLSSDAVETDPQRKLVIESTVMLTKSIGLGECFSPIPSASHFILDLPEIPIDLANSDSDDRKKAALWWLLAHLFRQFEMNPETLLALIPTEYRLSLMGQCVGDLENGLAAWVSYCGQWVATPTLETVVRDLLLRLSESELVLLFKILRGLCGLEAPGQRR